VVVIGGGIAGLAAAYRILQTADDLDVTVLEGASEIGGKLRLGEIAGVQTDLGAEVMLNRRPEATDLACSVGLEASIVHPATTTAGFGRAAGSPSCPAD
jgi:oxygen-dependent protoporphyrinogen oxidase